MPNRRPRRPRVRGRFVEFYQAADGWRWRKWASNQHVLADSGEAYTRLADAVIGARRAGVATKGDVVTRGRR